MVTAWLIGGRVGEAATEAPHLSHPRAAESPSRHRGLRPRRAHVPHPGTHPSREPGWKQPLLTTPVDHSTKPVHLRTDSPRELSSYIAKENPKPDNSCMLRLCPSLQRVSSGRGNGLKHRPPAWRTPLRLPQHIYPPPNAGLRG